MPRMLSIEHADLFYSIIVSLCWMYRRPITMVDLGDFLDLSQKQILRMLTKLEKRGRIAKIRQRRAESRRPCVAWVIADRDNLPIEIRNVCQNCGAPNPTEIHRDMRLCDACLVAVEDCGQRLSLSSEDEEELSIYLTTIVTYPNEHTLG